MENIHKNIGERIRQKREIKKLSQEDMAHRLNLSNSAYGKLERGETKYDIERLKQIAISLDTSIAELVDGNIFYNIENVTHSPVALHHSSNNFPDVEAFNDIAKTAQMLPGLIEKQNLLMEKMLSIIEREK
jgi:transcriptional regulator with XRE-family HTH domain